MDPKPMQDKPQATPGPWVVNRPSDLDMDTGIVVSTTVAGIWPAVAECLSDDEGRMEADANLIAAAPDLLDAAIYAARKADPYSEAFWRLTKGIAAATGHDVDVVRREFRKADGGAL